MIKCIIHLSYKSENNIALLECQSITVIPGLYVLVYFYHICGVHEYKLL